MGATCQAPSSFLKTRPLRQIVTVLEFANFVSYNERETFLDSLFLEQIMKAHRLVLWLTAAAFSLTVTMVGARGGGGGGMGGGMGGNGGGQSAGSTYRGGQVDQTRTQTRDQSQDRTREQERTQTRDQEHSQSSEQDRIQSRDRIHTPATSPATN